MSTLVKQDGKWVLVAGGTRTWTGTKAELEAAVKDNKIPDGTAVMVTDDYSDSDLDDRISFLEGLLLGSGADSEDGGASDGDYTLKDDGTYQYNGSDANRVVAIENRMALLETKLNQVLAAHSQEVVK